MRHRIYLRYIEGTTCQVAIKRRPTQRLGMRHLIVSALLATATGQLTCQSGQGLFHTTTLVHTGADDIEENHASYNSTGGRMDACEDVGYVFEGSADLELGNDVQHLGKCGQYVGIRFQNLNVPAGATIMQATIKFTVDESTQPVIKDGRTDDGAKSTTYWGNWTAPLEAHIRARKVADAPVWLDPASVDPDVVANRDCPTASQCFSNYDCPAMSRWDWIPEMSDCSYFEDGRFAAYMIQLGWEACTHRPQQAAPHCQHTHIYTLLAPSPPCLQLLPRSQTFRRTQTAMRLFTAIARAASVAGTTTRVQPSCTRP